MMVGGVLLLLWAQPPPPPPQSILPPPPTLVCGGLGVLSGGCRRGRSQQLPVLCSEAMLLGMLGG